MARVGRAPGAYAVLASSSMKKIPTFAHPRLAVAEPAIRAFGAHVVGLPFSAENSRIRNQDTQGHRLLRCTSNMPHAIHGNPTNKK